MKKIQEIEDILWTLRSINPDSYVKVDCDNTDKSTDSPFTANWAGLFPNVLFTNLNSLTMGKKIEIKENTESLEESKNYRTTFSGANFYSPVIGEWPWQQTWEGVDSRMVEVKIVSPTISSDPIYVWIGKIDLTPRGEESLGELI
ncbi:hypothetical protein OVS_03185 [Mycoplasma ovis str. Michigan]|uniref:Uncharacterized protein n=1 Tax=Mycoplasma ovis str. Michigan TaxID=1415773 RepID=A0ABN4BRB3_9MOLU|nr:hypothetical protein [Mycoplasma ovis]AHC40390.1 hypothetical protein OVS_03185 [Mycoplasma ovis str. Michigan]